MTADEQKDLEILKAEQQRVKVHTFEYAVAVSRYTADELKHSGYGGKSNADAVLAVIERGKKQIDELVKKHVRKYPD